MFVESPRRSSNGTTSRLNTLRCRTASPPSNGEPSEAAALVKAMVFNGTINSQASQTTRSFMQKGVTGFKTYVNTPYGATYYQAWSSGYNVCIKRRAGLFYSETLPMGVNYSGGFTTGVSFPTGDLNPYGVGVNPIALYNRAVYSGLLSRAEVECKNKLANVKLDASELLVDIDKTVLLVARSAMQVLYAWRSVRNGNYALAAKHLGITKSNLNFKNASSAWLEFQYGWRPLVSDVFGGIEHVNGILKGQPGLINVVRRISEDMWLGDAGPTEVNSASWTDLQYTKQATASVEVRLKAGVADANLAYLSSLQLLNPVYTAWIATPFSFVVDWFIPVGDWLASVSAPLGLKFGSGYRTLRVWGEMSASSNKKGMQQPALYTFISQSGNASAGVRVAYMDRKVYYAFPKPQLYFRFPFSNPERIASAIALTKSTTRFK